MQSFNGCSYPIVDQSSSFEALFLGEDGAVMDKGRIWQVVFEFKTSMKNLKKNTVESYYTSSALED
jgi:hypothetical protein